MPQSNRPDLRSIQTPVSEEEGSGTETEEEYSQNTSGSEQEHYVDLSEEEIQLKHMYPHPEELLQCGPPEPLSESAFLDNSDDLMIQILQEERQIYKCENPEHLNTSAFPDNSKEESQHEQVERVDQCDAPGLLSASALKDDSEELQIEHQDLRQKVQIDRDHYDVTEDLNTHPKRIRRQ
ncbi:uncharacterized protein TNIN_387021 [Trichonephila inaurata madagascariensis]|uniref:Uncharacterized protein n=1 Tax=Trichonephila inaurata madagascariensis TaxID=2747483 RepID=A0A8X6X5T8_9ARAC|nr:uncharacterized protein TNIN_387021 [Trichonephila inaurata madagascariensis]